MKIFFIIFPIRKGHALLDLTLDSLVVEGIIVKFITSLVSPL
jgi:hypothetical protein